ncbi:MAG: thiamine phosphate synthase [Acidobacteria bacterium]|nr:MAG: thiamine phosphate synthase [Acidobacteriota bacterium]
MVTPDKFILCYVTDRGSLDIAAGTDREADLAQRIRNAVCAGVHWVQIREKDLPARNLIDLTRSAIRACNNLSTQGAARILVNDRCDVAWAAGAAGVHAGEKSLPVQVLIDARRTSGLTNFLVGASCHSVGGAIAAAEQGADYLFFGPVFATPSKAGFGPPQGLDKLAQVGGAVSIPVIAIGGITLENARACREAGAAGIAAIRLFQQHGDLAKIVASLTAK